MSRTLALCFILVTALALALTLPLPALSGSEHPSAAEASPPHTTRAAPGVTRHKHCHLERSRKARAAFMRSHPCPSTGKTSGACPGYVVDHIKALKHGGADAPSNMQWQTIEAAKIKDKTE